MTNPDVDWSCPVCRSVLPMDGGGRDDARKAQESHEAACPENPKNIKDSMKVLGLHRLIAEAALDGRDVAVIVVGRAGQSSQVSWTGGGERDRSIAIRLLQAALMVGATRADGRDFEFSFLPLDIGALPHLFLPRFMASYGYGVMDHGPGEW